MSSPSTPYSDGSKKTRGSGRPHVWAEPTVKVALQLPEDLAKLLRTRAVREGVSVSRLVGDLVVQREMEDCIARGEADIAAERVVTWEDFKVELDKWR